MGREHIEDLVAKEVEKIIAGSDLELVDIEYVRERNWYLRVFIDKKGGVDLEDCQSVSEKLRSILARSGPRIEERKRLYPLSGTDSRYPFL